MSKPRINTTRCGHCDLGMGRRGMDRCPRCDSTGSVFTVNIDGKILTFPNTEEGFKKAEKYGEWIEPK